MKLKVIARYEFVNKSIRL